jgi:hypothetical protein
LLALESGVTDLELLLLLLLPGAGGDAGLELVLLGGVLLFGGVTGLELFVLLLLDGGVTGRLPFPLDPVLPPAFISVLP